MVGTAQVRLCPPYPLTNDVKTELEGERVSQ
jgi:hypothetical protein